jgi:hypothetical protein
LKKKLTIIYDRADNSFEKRPPENSQEFRKKPKCRTMLI